MRINQIAGLSLCLALLCSCNPGSKLSQGEVAKGEAYQSSADAEVPLGSQTVALPSADAQLEMPVEVTENPMPEFEEMATEEKDPVAMEPVPIGGAFLTCRYQSGQAQGSENYRMDCDVAPAVEVEAVIAKAEFFKLDTQGNRTPLTIVSQDLLALRWTIQESATTVPQNRVQIVLSALGALSVSLTTTVTSPMVLARSAAFWLGGEPNNTVLNNEDEDCVEFSNAAMKTSHQNTSGRVTGALGRMNDIACSSRYNFLCRNISAGDNAAKWIVSTLAGTFAESVRACAQGYAFGFPLTEAEVREVSAIVDRNNRAQNIWVNMSDRTKENEFIALFR